MGFLTRQSLVGLFTVVEVVGLVVWLGLARGTVAFEPAEQLGVAAPTAAVGLGVLFVALYVEHLLTDAAVNGIDLNVPLIAPLVFSATETALWGAWLALAEIVGGLFGVGVAGVVLAVLLVPQHTIEDNALRGDGILSELIDVGTLGFSVVEAVAATAWLALVFRESLLADLGVATSIDPALVGLGALAVLLFVEHNVGVQFSRRRPTGQPIRSADDRTTRG
jgi:hypothetical protein